MPLFLGSTAEGMRAKEPLKAQGTLCVHSDTARATAGAPYKAGDSSW